MGIVPRGSIEIELKLKMLAILNVKGMPIRRNWHVVMHQGKRLSAVADEFRSLLVDEAQTLLSGKSS